MDLEKLENPPIIEVACGVVFDEIVDLDPFTLAAYRASKQALFPEHQLHPPITDRPIAVNGLPPIRTWLVSADGAWIIQIQRDRFYVNWRARESQYPRFADHDGKDGVLSKFLREFEEFSKYCKSTFRLGLTAKRLELSKINYLEKEQSWSDLNDLGTMLPCLSPFVDISTKSNQSMFFHFRDGTDDEVLDVSMEVAPNVKLEMRLQKPINGDVRNEFEAANHAVNRVFAKLIPKEQRTQRFQKGTP